MHNWGCIIKLMTKTTFSNPTDVEDADEGRIHLIKKIWLENRDTMKATEIFQTKLASFFNDIKIETAHSFNNKEFVAFTNMIRKWKKEEEEKIALDDMDKLTTEDADQLQERNRRVMIVLLSRALKMYEKNPKMLKNMDVAEIRRLYQTVQSADERARMTAIQKGKLKLEVARTILPYKRLTPEELIKLREAANDAIGQIIKLKGEGKGSGFGGITEPVHAT